MSRRLDGGEQRAQAPASPAPERESSRRRRILLAVGAAACLGLAAVLFLMALDTTRWRDTFPTDDVRYRAAPEETLWHPSTLVPGDPAKLVLGVGDDVRFREAVQSLRQGRLDLGFTSDPALALPRAEAQARLAKVSQSDPSAERRSRALGLQGVISFAGSIYESRGQAALVAEAVSDFQAALAIDPTNDEAKANLEQALQRRKALAALAGAGATDPAPGGEGSRGAGAANTGSGY
jgi:hypothetical protein